MWEERPAHRHLIVEPPAGSRGTGVEKALANAMRGLAIRIARTLNAALGRRGSAFAHRYHSRGLASPREVKRARTWLLRTGWHQEHGGLDAFASLVRV